MKPEDIIIKPIVTEKSNQGLEEYRGVYVFAQQVDNELSGIAFSA